jgi:hypothetical protein
MSGMAKTTIVESMAAMSTPKVVTLRAIHL